MRRLRVRNTLALLGVIAFADACAALGVAPPPCDPGTSLGMFTECEPKALACKGHPRSAPECAGLVECESKIKARRDQCLK